MVKLTFDNSNLYRSATRKKSSKNRSSSQKDDRSDYYTVERIVAMEGKGTNARFLVKWEGYPDSQNTWEPYKNLKDCPSILEEFFAKLKSKGAKRSMSMQRETNTKPKPASKSRSDAPKIIDLLTRKERKNLSLANNLIQIIDQLEVGQSSETISLIGEEDKINNRRSITRSRRQSNEPTPQSNVSYAKKAKLIKTNKIKGPIPSIPRTDQKKKKPFKDQQPTFVDIIDYKPSENTQTSCPNFSTSNENSKFSRLSIASTADVKHRASLAKGAKTKPKSCNLDVVEKADSIAQHITLDGEIFFKLSWANGNVSSDVANLIFSYDEVDRYNPRLLTSYLKQFIKVTNK